MKRDGVELLKDVPVKQITPEQARGVMAEAAKEADRMEAMLNSSIEEIPRFRPACDIPPCAYQRICYRT
jgi:hypothetical protein